jgi:hypothetical protein
VNDKIRSEGLTYLESGKSFSQVFARAVETGITGNAKRSCAGGGRDQDVYLTKNHR